MLERVLIIGGNSGIGLELKNLLEKNGVEVIAISRSGDGLDFNDDKPMFKEINGPVDTLVYCPGTINLKPFSSLKIEDFIQDININFLGAVKSIKNYLPNLKQSKNASVLMFSSVAVQRGMPFHSSIGSAKGAVEGLTRSLAAEFAPSIRVNCISPSLTNTNLSSKLLRNDRQKESATNRHPLKAIGEPLDIAEMAAFLISKKSKWITGQVIGIDGGLSTLTS